MLTENPRCNACCFQSLRRGWPYQILAKTGCFAFMGSILRRWYKTSLRFSCRLNITAAATAMAQWEASIVITNSSFKISSIFPAEDRKFSTEENIASDNEMYTATRHANSLAAKRTADLTIWELQNKEPSPGGLIWHSGVRRCLKDSSLCNTAVGWLVYHVVTLRSVIDLGNIDILDTWLIANRSESSVPQATCSGLYSCLVSMSGAFSVTVPYSDKCWERSHGSVDGIPEYGISGWKPPQIHQLCLQSLSYFQTSQIDQGAVSIRKTVFPGMAIPMLKIRRPNGRLIFNMEIAIRK